MKNKEVTSIMILPAAPLDIASTSCCPNIGTAIVGIVYLAQ